MAAPRYARHSTSRRCSARVREGLSHSAEFWKERANSFIRRGLRARSSMASSSLPLRYTCPLTWASGSDRQAMARARVVLPLPDSPTMVSISPASRAKLTGWRVNSG